MTPVSSDTPAFPPPGKDTCDEIRRTLHHLIDPEVGVNVVDLGMIGAIEVDSGGNAVVEIMPTTAGCPMHDMLAQGASSLVSRVAGVTSVEVRFVYDPPWTPDRMSEDARNRLQGGSDDA